ncbi:hypothetical protein ACIQK9_16000 [Streptomyces hydrogenans]|uniref:hypothetical protein n=1 Tax=Streptomyces hydrogenans TaxID=1873719 RepID=UPI0038206037
MAQDIALLPVVDPALDDAERALLEKSADGLFPATRPLPEEPGLGAPPAGHGIGSAAAISTSEPDAWMRCQTIVR